jgi:outer membrane protein, multidrug efflux system
MLRYCSITVLGVLLLAGCALGPDYIRPELELPTATDTDAAQFAPFTAENWWKIFEDSTLDRIQAEALIYNRDLRAAAARVEEARAFAREALADRLPAVGIGGAAGRERTSIWDAPPAGSRTSDFFEALGYASFELDFWGLYRRLDEAARAELLATEAARDAVRLTLTADVAALYFHLRTVEAQTHIAREQLATYDTTRDMYRKRYEAGYTQELDLRRIEADRLATEALVYRRENELSRAGTALAMLLGRSPAEIVQGFSEKGRVLEDLNVFPRIPEDIPSDLLIRRPDICREEGMLIAANARIGTARAAFFPAIRLTGASGFVSSDLNELFTRDASVWNAAAVLTQPVFEGGRLFAREKAARARHEQMLARYEQTVQNAFRETRDALVAGTKTAQALEASLERARSMRRSFELSQKQHASGHISIIDVLDIQRQALLAELDLADARRDQLDAVIALCRAMGGGWQESSDPVEVY